MMIWMKELLASSALWGVEPKAETASVKGMKAESKNPSEDLPNQEKNQYWTVYWWEQVK